MNKQRLVIYRIGAIGDVIHTLPLVKLIRAKNPEARIDYLVGSNQLVELLSTCAPYIDKVWLISKNFSEAKGFLESLKKEAVTEFVFLHSGFLKAYWLNLAYIHAPRLIIYKADREISAVANYVSSYYPQLRKEILEKPFEVLEYKTLSLTQANTNSESLPPKLKENSDYVCVVPGVGHLRPHRAYPLDKWVTLIKEILKDTNYSIKILGGPDELELSLELEKKLETVDRSRIDNLIGKTTLVELVELINSAQHLYSADTGILHIAAALGKPLTTMFSITSEKRFGPFTPHAEILRSSDCSCQSSFTNLAKHCSNLEDAYAKCMWSIDISMK